MLSRMTLRLRKARKGSVSESADMADLNLRVVSQFNRHDACVNDVGGVGTAGIAAEAEHF